MERMISGLMWLACVPLFFTLHVSLASVSVNVTATVDVIKGETARLPCTYTTTGTMTVVQWFIESADIRTRVAFRSSTDTGLDENTAVTGRVTMEDDMTLVISPVHVSDERSFFCQVNGGPVGTSEAETKLKVFFAPEKPVVSENKQPIPLSQDNVVDHQVGKCTSNNGFPKPRIVWFNDSNPLPDTPDPITERHYVVPRTVKESSGLFTISSTLYLKPNKMDAKSVFHCTVVYKMPNGKTGNKNSDPFNLTLLYPSENVFFTLLNTSPIKEGDEVKMKCETDGNPQPQFDFIKNDVMLQSGPELLVLHNVTRNSSGTYKCEAMDFDAIGVNLTKILTINVHHLDPVSVEPPSPLMINKGGPIELQCMTKASDEYTLLWMKDGKQLSKDGTLNLQSADLDSAGEYVCIASVPSVPGLQKQANITVIISGQPEIDEPMTGKVARQGDMVTLSCSAKGYPNPQFIWNPSGKQSVNVKGNKITSTNTLEVTATVLKEGVTCEATNQHGTDSKKFRVELDSGNVINTNDGAKGRHLSLLSLLFSSFSGLFLLHIL
ncbi:basal cell adhesion molecule isoform X2 [Neoarius graeffei]|uniref:basal cell adhesion molecule isoform X2 n=1 Tax=Neoarius graeffei TaxID=443677 RepID=UPI00298CAE97|nr:basal cell adhesion molecule isoform X2 [Neoarius graeffei]